MPVETPRPQYRQVAAGLRDLIRSGASGYRRGEMIPAEPELAEHFGVTRSVVNQALSILRSEGLLRPERGRGTIVNPLPVLARHSTTRQDRSSRETGQARGAFQAEMEAQGLTAGSAATVSEVTADADTAALMQVKAGTPVIQRRRVMSADGVPVQIAVSWIPASIAAGTPIAQADPGPGGVYSRLTDLGHAPARHREIQRVRIPEDDEAAVLGIDPDHRVYDIARITWDAEGLVIEVTRMIMPAHQWELISDWDAQ